MMESAFPTQYNRLKSSLKSIHSNNLSIKRVNKDVFASLQAMMNRRFLIIDDDKVFVFMMKDILTKKNHTVLVAETIEEGMVLLKDKGLEFVFLDNQLPDGLGWGQAEYILANYPNIQLNLISALDVPKTSTSSFRIWEKQLLLEELRNNF